MTPRFKSHTVKPAASRKLVGRRNTKTSGAFRIKIHFEPAAALLRRIRFQLKAPTAGSVKLAADFTAWDTLPMEMKRTRDGQWRATVPLTPGEYAYRYIVDGRWYDDPTADRVEANPFGTLNAIKEVS